MKKKKYLSCLLAATMLVMALTACSKTDAQEATTVQEATQSVEQTTESTTENTGAAESTQETVTATENAAESTAVATEAAETTESQANVETTVEASAETAAALAEDLPGINRNGRYADIPESVLPSSVAANAEFLDEPIYGKPWPDVTGKIYADYMRTQVLKVAEYGVDDFNVIAYCGEDEANGLYGNLIVIYNGQYAVVNEVAFAIWVNGIDPEFN